MTTTSVSTIFLEILNSLFLKNFFKFIFRCTRSSFLLSGFSPVAGSRGYSLVSVSRVLIAAASLVAEHSL